MDVLEGGDPSQGSLEIRTVGISDPSEPILVQNPTLLVMNDR